MITLIIIFAFLLKRGLNQNNGKASGPTAKKAVIKTEVLKYHLLCFSLIFTPFPKNGAGPLFNPLQLNQKA